MRKILFLGHNGPLGRDFCSRFSEDFEIIGVSRSPSTLARRNIQADVKHIDFSSLLKNIDDVIYAPNSFTWATAGYSNSIASELIDTHVTSLIRLIASIESRPVKTLTVISSRASLREAGNTILQGVYCTVKMAQNNLVKQAVTQITGRVNAILPPAFPSVVPTEMVSDRIVSVIEGSENGQVIQL